MVSRLFLISVLGLSIVYGQSNQASISGIVTDSAGARIPGAKVTATSTATGVALSTVTNDSGFYSLPNVPIGLCTVVIENQGFRRYERKDITLSTGQALDLSVRMELGALAETVTVTGEAALVESRTSDVSSLIEYKSIENLPLGNRRTLNIVSMTGAAVFVNYGNTPGNVNPNFSLAGGRAQSQMMWIDGGAGQNMRIGAGQINLDPPVETVSEIKVLSNNTSAEYGGSASGIIVQNTKSGTNQFHGSAYEYLRNDAMDAPGFFAAIRDGAKVKAPLRYNVFGGTFGGPIRRDQTFFFFAYEGQRLRTGGIDTLTVPTAAQRAGDFSQTLNSAGRLIQIYDPATTRTTGGVSVRDPFPDNRIPATQLDPVAVNITKFYPTPNRTPDSITGANNVRGNYVGASNADFVMAKIDHNIGSRDKITGRYMYNNGQNRNSSVYPEPAADTRNGADNQQQYAYGNWTRTLSPTAVNELRFSYLYRLFHNISAGLGGGWPTKIGIKGVPDDAFPQFVVAGFSNLGSNAQERQQYPIEQHQVVDNFSKVISRHTLKFGFEARRSRNHEFNFPTISGAFTFGTQPTGLPGNAATGIGLASLLLGFPTAFAQNQTQELDRSSWYLAAFAQDSWTVNPSLTLNYGLRWETDTPMVDSNNRMNSFDLRQINPVSGTPGVVKFLGLNGFQTKPYSLDWNNFGPRFGFAWKLFGKDQTVVRGGYGVFFAHPFDAGVPNAAAVGFSVSVALNSPDNGITAPFYLRNGVTGTAVPPTLDDRYGAVPVGTNPNTSVPFFELDRRPGYSHQFNLGAQHQLGGASVVEVTVLGNLAHKLASANITLNQIPLSILGPQNQTQRSRPFPQFSDVLIQSPTFGNSRYYAALVRYQKRYSGGLSLGGHYTWSRFFTDANDPGGTLGNNGGAYSNAYNRKADWGNAANDIRHRFSMNGVYELPFGKGKRWLSASSLRHVVGDWSISGVATVQTGPPCTVGTQTNSTNAFSAGGLRADVSRNPNLPSDQQSVSHWFDTAAFSQPAPYTFGNQGVGTVRADGIINFDLSAQKAFRITEKIRAELRGESFNTFNHTNFGVPGLTFGGAGFGVVNSSGPARSLQVGARIAF